MSDKNIIENILNDIRAIRKEHHLSNVYAKLDTILELYGKTKSTIVVMIPNSNDHGGLEHNTMKVRIPDTCPKCGAKRAVKLYLGASDHNGRRLFVDCWENDCGHLDTYNDIRKGIAEGVNTQVPWDTPTTLEERATKSKQ